MISQELTGLPTTIGNCLFLSASDLPARRGEGSAFPITLQTLENFGGLTRHPHLNPPQENPNLNS